MTRTWRALWALGLAACASTPVTTPRASLPPPVRDDSDVLSERLAAFGEVLKSQGYAETSFRARGFLPPSSRETQPVAVPAHTCALFVALASPTVDDLDAAVYGAEGEVLVEDEGSDARPVLTLCAGEKALSLYYSVHAYQGAGAFVARVYQRPRQAGDGELTVGDGAPSSLSAQLRELHKRGFQDDGPPLDVAVGEGPLRVAVPVVSGECYSLLAEAPGPVRMRLLDAQGKEVALGVSEGPVAALQHCAQESGDYGVEIGAGAGAVTFARLHAPQANVGGARALWLGEPSPSELGLGKPAPSRKAVEATLRAEGARLSFFETFALEQGRLRELSLPRAQSRCERVELRLHEGLASARLRVETSDGEALGELAVGAAGGSLTLCDRRAGARVVVTGASGFGSVTVLSASLR